MDVRKYHIENAKELMPGLVNVPENYFMSDTVPKARLLCDQSKFYDFLLRDFPLAENSVLIYSPFMTEQRVASILPHFADMISRGVSISIVTKAFERTMSKRDKRSRVKCEYILKQNGINVFHKLGMHEKLVLIDDHIIWSGSLNVLSHNNKTSEYMQRIDDEDFFADCIKLFNADQYLHLLDEQQEQRCPICGEEMVAREGSQGIYWVCVNNDYTRNANQPYPYDGILRCQKCGGEFHFSMKKEPRWICENKHYQKVRKNDLKLPKMRALVECDDQKRVAEFFNLESLSDTGSKSKSGPLLSAHDLEQYYEELDQTSIVIPVEARALEKKVPGTAARRVQKPKTRVVPYTDNDNNRTPTTALQDAESNSERLIKDILLDEKYHQLVLYCEANGYETLDDIKSLTFDEILSVPGMTTQLANELLDSIEDDVVEQKEKSSHGGDLKEPDLIIEHKYSKEARGTSSEESKKTVQREYRKSERKTDENRKRKESTKAESRSNSSVKGLFDRLDEYGFGYIDNSASSGIIWVTLTEAQKESKRHILEKVLDQRRLKYAYEPRGAMATKGRPAYRIMLGEK